MVVLGRGARSLGPAAALLLILLVCLAPPAAAGRSETAFHGRYEGLEEIGRFDRNPEGRATPAWFRGARLSNLGRHHADLDAVYRHDINPRMVFDVTDRFRGTFHGPEARELDRLSEISNDLTLALGIDHDGRTLSRLSLDLEQLRYPESGFTDFSGNRTSLAWLVDHEWGPDVHLLFRTARDTLGFDTHSVDNHLATTQRLVLTRTIRSVGEPPSFFRSYAWDRLPGEGDGQRMDATWSIGAEYENRNLPNAPAGDATRIGTALAGLSLEFSPLARLVLDYRGSRRTQDAESPARAVLNHDRAEFSAGLSHWLVRNLYAEFYSDLVKLDFLNFQGFNRTELVNGLRLDYYHSRSITAGLDLARQSSRKYQPIVPEAGGSNWIGRLTWHRQLSRNLAVWWKIETDIRDTDLPAIAYDPRYRDTRFDLWWDRTLNDTWSVDFGGGLRDRTHPEFQYEDARESFLGVSVKARF